MENIIKRKCDKLYVKWKTYNNSFNSCVYKKIHEYFPQLNSLETNVKVELDLSNYGAKIELKNATGVDTSSFAKKSDLANLKSDVDKIDIDELKNVTSNLNNSKNKVNRLDIKKLETTPVDLIKLSNLVKNDVVNKDLYNAKILKKYVR